MLGFSQAIRPRASVAASVPGDGSADGHDQPASGLRAVATHWGELSLREQEILLMRFRGDMTQAQIGQRLCISQMQVSRLIARALGYLRSQLLDLEVTHPGAGPAVAPPTVSASAMK
jgi:DNA-binding CsgD family transcriptional regulator